MKEFSERKAKCDLVGRKNVSIVFKANNKSALRIDILDLMEFKGFAQTSLRRDHELEVCL